MPMTARPVESLGVKTADLGGFALGAVTCLIELLTDMSEMVEDAHRIARHINVPSGGAAHLEDRGRWSDRRSVS